MWPMLWATGTLVKKKSCPSLDYVTPAPMKNKNRGRWMCITTVFKIATKLQVWEGGHRP